MRQEGKEDRGKKPPRWNPDPRNGNTGIVAVVGSQQQNLNVHAWQPTIATYSANVRTCQFTDTFEHI